MLAKNGQIVAQPKPAEAEPNDAVPTSGLLPVITIDSNEQRAKYVEILGQDDLFEIQQRRLDVGDILIDQLIIERKTHLDFCESLRDGRLFRQLLLMRRLYLKRMLLIEGDLRQRSVFSDSAIQGAITRICANLQIPILYSENSCMTASLLRRTALQLYGFSATQARRMIGEERTQDYQEIYVLVGISGVGLARARALIKHFGSLQRVFNASESELCKVLGIGTYLASNLVRLFRGG